MTFNILRTLSKNYSNKQNDQKLKTRVQSAIRLSIVGPKPNLPKRPIGVK